MVEPIAARLEAVAILFGRFSPKRPNPNVSGAKAWPPLLRVSRGMNMGHHMVTHHNVVTNNRTTALVSAGSRQMSAGMRLSQPGSGRKNGRERSLHVHVAPNTPPQPTTSFTGRSRQELWSINNPIQPIRFHRFQYPLFSARDQRRERKRRSTAGEHQHRQLVLLDSYALVRTRGPTRYREFGVN